MPARKLQPLRYATYDEVGRDFTRLTGIIPIKDGIRRVHDAETKSDYLQLPLAKNSSIRSRLSSKPSVAKPREMTIDLLASKEVVSFKVAHLHRIDSVLSEVVDVARPGSINKEPGETTLTLEEVQARLNALPSTFKPLLAVALKALSTLLNTGTFDSKSFMSTKEGYYSLKFLATCVLVGHILKAPVFIGLAQEEINHAFVKHEALPVTITKNDVQLCLAVSPLLDSTLISLLKIYDDTKLASFQALRESHNEVHPKSWEMIRSLGAGEAVDKATDTQVDDLTALDLDKKAVTKTPEAGLAIAQSHRAQASASLDKKAVTKTPEAGLAIAQSHRAQVSASLDSKPDSQNGTRRPKLSRKSSTTALPPSSSNTTPPKPSTDPDLSDSNDSDPIQVPRRRKRIASSKLQATTAPKSSDSEDSEPIQPSHRRKRTMGSQLQLTTASKSSDSELSEPVRVSGRRKSTTSTRLKSVADRASSDSGPPQPVETSHRLKRNATTQLHSPKNKKPKASRPASITAKAVSRSKLAATKPRKADWGKNAAGSSTATTSIRKPVAPAKATKPKLAVRLDSANSTDHGGSTKSATRTARNASGRGMLQANKQPSTLAMNSLKRPLPSAASTLPCNQKTIYGGPKKQSSISGRGSQDEGHLTLPPGGHLEMLSQAVSGQKAALREDKGNRAQDRRARERGEMWHA